MLFHKTYAYNKQLAIGIFRKKRLDLFSGQVIDCDTGLDVRVERELYAVLARFFRAV